MGFSAFLTSNFGETRKEDSPAEKARGGKEFQPGGQGQEQPGLGAGSAICSPDVQGADA